MLFQRISANRKTDGSGAAPQFTAHSILRSRLVINSKGSVQEYDNSENAAPHNQIGEVLRVFHAAVRCTTEVLQYMHQRRFEWAARADIERLFANDCHIMRDIGLFDATSRHLSGNSFEHLEVLAALSRCERHWGFNHIREEG